MIANGVDFDLESTDILNAADLIKNVKDTVLKELILSDSAESRIDRYE